MFSGPPNVDKLKARRDVSGLIKALQYRKDAEIRRKAAGALGHFVETSPRDRAAVPQLVVVVVADSAISGRSSEERRPSEIPASAEVAERVTQALLIALMDEDNTVVKAAIASLGFSRDERAYLAIYVCLKSPDSSVRFKAMEYLTLGWNTEAHPALWTFVETAPLHGDYLEDIRCALGFLTIFDRAKGFGPGTDTYEEISGYVRQNAPALIRVLSEPELSDLWPVMASKLEKAGIDADAAQLRPVIDDLCQIVFGESAFDRELTEKAMMSLGRLLWEPNGIREELACYGMAVIAGMAKAREPLGDVLVRCAADSTTGSFDALTWFVLRFDLDEVWSTYASLLDRFLGGMDGAVLDRLVERPDELQRSHERALQAYHAAMADYEATDPGETGAGDKRTAPPKLPAPPGSQAGSVASIAAEEVKRRRSSHAPAAGR